jgi:hypothetical protein
MRPAVKSAFAVSSAFLAFTYCSLAQALQPAGSEPPLRRIDAHELCVTNGAVQTLPDGRLAIDTPSSRAVVTPPTAQTAEIRFNYLGPSKTSKPLASGELRRQIGLKLRAQDTCNLLYAMWHIEPDSKIAVSIKRNPGMHTHEQCHASGYETVRPRSHIDLPKVMPGETHMLRAELRRTDLTIIADDRVVWQGTVGNAIDEFDGPVGLRTDNARFAFEYYAGAVSPDTRSKALDRAINRCVASPGD